MPKIPPEKDQVAEPDVVHSSPLQLKLGRVLLGLLAGVIIIAIGVVGARIFSSVFDTETTPISPIEIKTGTSSAQKDETADWQIHECKLVKVYFKAPPSWKIEEKEGSYPDGRKYTLVSAKDQNTSRNFGISENAVVGIGPPHEIPSLKEEVIIDGVKTTKTYYKAAEGLKDPSEVPDRPILMGIKMNVNGNDYLITSNVDPDDYQETDKIISQILKTIKFC